MTHCFVSLCQKSKLLEDDKKTHRGMRVFKDKKTEKQKGVIEKETKLALYGYQNEGL